jgi:transposase InsO family protein
MLVELSVVEQRYHAVMEVLASHVPVIEVAERYGVSRKTVHAWIRRYEAEGLAGLADRSHRPHHHPWQLTPEIEAIILEMRRAHPRWGPRRLAHELGRAGIDPLPSRSTIYRVLVRHQLVQAQPRKRRRADYKRWERPAPMQLWQMDIMGSVLLADGGEVKLISGVDDHSRFCVIAQVVTRATARAVCAAFAAALSEYGCPEEVLTDNGKQFTGKYGHPRPVEVLFDRICRRNGIGHLLTKVRSPTTTGKIERWHQTIQTELLDGLDPFADLAAAQAAVDAWRTEYNHARPHQALGMASPAERFRPVPVEQRNVLPLWLPPELNAAAQAADVVPSVAPLEDVVGPVPTALAWPDALEVDRVVPPSGNLAVRGQQFWLGPARAGLPVTLWMDTTTVHVSLDGCYLKTLPCRLSVVDLARLRAEGARPAGPPPVRQPSGLLAEAGAVDIERTVTACGAVRLAGRQVSVGMVLAGRRVTLRLEAGLMHVIAEGVLMRTLPFALSPGQRARLYGARLAGPAPQPAQGPLRVGRRVSCQGSLQVAGQRVQVGMGHAGKTVIVEVDESMLRIVDEHGQLLAAVPRTSSKEVKRFKAYGSATRTVG